MLIDEVVTELLLRWEDKPSLTPEELCREYKDHPEHAALLKAVQRGICDLQAAASFLETSQEDGNRSSVWSCDPAVPTLAGERVAVPGYEIFDLLGKGGMGVVYRARQLGLGRVVVLKMILNAAYASVEERLRFQLEAEAVARLQHPGVVQIFEVGEAEGLAFFSMEYCPGGSLAKKLEGRPWEAGTAARLVETLAQAVSAAHLAGVVHRDLKPGNVLLATDGTPKIADFGLAKKLDEQGITRTGAIMGTPSYMAPEQASGKSKGAGPAADIYALGAILYELLTGRPPFKAATDMDTLLQVISEAPVPPRLLQSKVPRDLETICLKCLRKDPRHRYATAAELAEDLKRFEDGEPIRARPVGLREQWVRWWKREPAAAVGLPIVAVLALAGVQTALFPVPVAPLFILWLGLTIVVGLARRFVVLATLAFVTLATMVVGISTSLDFGIPAVFAWWADGCVAAAWVSMYYILVSRAVAWYFQSSIGAHFLWSFAGSFVGLWIGGFLAGIFYVAIEAFKGPLGPKNDWLETTWWFSVLGVLLFGLGFVAGTVGGGIFGIKRQQWLRRQRLRR